MDNDCPRCTIIRRSDLEEQLLTRFVGRPLYWVDEIDSTNRMLLEWATEGAAEGTVLAADVQTAGRGRRGRRWVAPLGTGLLLSILVRPADGVAVVPLATAVAVAEAIEERVPGGHVRVKWPNDVRIRDRKVAGILTEAYTAGDETALVVGIGVNVRVPTDVLDALPTPATSLSLESECSVSRIDLLTTLLSQWERVYERVQAGTWSLSSWRQRTDMLGRCITVVEDESVWRGTAVDVAGDGALIVRQETGTVRRLYAGDVTIRSPVRYIS